MPTNDRPAYIAGLNDRMARVSVRGSQVHLTLYDNEGVNAGEIRLDADGGALLRDEFADAVSRAVEARDSQIDRAVAILAFGSDMPGLRAHLASQMTAGLIDPVAVINAHKTRQQFEASE